MESIDEKCDPRIYWEAPLFGKGQMSCIDVLSNVYSIDFNPLMLRVTCDNDIWIFHTFDNNLEMKNVFMTYLKESRW